MLTAHDYEMAAHALDRRAAELEERAAHGDKCAGELAQENRASAARFRRATDEAEDRNAWKGRGLDSHAARVAEEMRINEAEMWGAAGRPTFRR